jgi:hypothetical protein
MAAVMRSSIKNVENNILQPTLDWLLMCIVLSEPNESSVAISNVLTYFILSKLCFIRKIVRKSLSKLINKNKHKSFGGDDK